MTTRKLIVTPLAVAIGTAFIASSAMAADLDSHELAFGSVDLNQGYMLGGDKGEEGSCGEGDKGEEGSCGEGSCGEGDKGEEGSCGEGDHDKGEEGSSGEGDHDKGEEGSCGGLS
ncbi:MAG: hypothetical protein PF630_09715 [Gammaproteobacteria bacterium]|jgi:uncharacterized low-complexity protein|nr:hypothetical protein [Gammaproteobacteria bacterium]